MKNRVALRMLDSSKHDRSQIFKLQEENQQQGYKISVKGAELKIQKFQQIKLFTKALRFARKDITKIRSPNKHQEFNFGY